MIDQIMIRRRKIERFIESIKDLPEAVTEFDESLWAGLVDSMTLYSKDRIVFRLTCGMEMDTSIVHSSVCNQCNDKQIPEYS